MATASYMLQWAAMNSSLIAYTLLGATLLLGTTTGYLIWQHGALITRSEMLLGERQYFMQALSSTTDELASERSIASTTIADLTEQINTLETNLAETEMRLRAEQNRNSDFADQLSDLAGTVGVLDKLAKTDRELLQKYSKVYFLNENYRPERLTQIPSRYVQPGKKDQYFHTAAWPFLKALLDDAAKAGVTLQVVSAFRSFDEQVELKDQFVQRYGSGANAFSADQGFSEHQLGTAVDLTDPATGGTFGSLASTSAYAWLLENAHRYGFILSYPEKNAFYIFEPWHWRFVGVALAKDLDRAGDHFYDWEQRKIDDYLVKIFD